MNKFLGSENIETLTSVTQIDRGNGRVAIQLSNGKYFSISPLGIAWEADTIGIWEEALVTSKGLLYDGSGDPNFNGKAYLRILI